MTTMSWFQSGATPRGTPASRRALPRQPVVLLVLAAAALGLSGCQAGGCGTCGALRNGVRNLSERAFRPFRAIGSSLSSAGPCCGGSLGSAAGPLQYGPPATIVSPGVVGSPSGTTVVPGTSTDSFPSALEPIPSATPGPAPGASSEVVPREGNKSQTGKANYEASRPRLGDPKRAGGNLARSLTSSPEPTPRSAQGPARSNVADPNPLDNLPPLDLPKDVSQANNSSTTSAAANRLPKADPGPVPADDTAADAARGLPAPAAPAETTVAPGLRRFAGVEPKLAGGSLPTIEGLDWLVEKGYRTILDLRENASANPTFLNEADRRGLRYVALPITLKTVDLNHVTRFRSELSLADARPLYFCDTDGTRAGVMWYVHRIMVDKVDEQVARRDAEEIGLSDETFLKVAREYIASSKHNPVPAAAPAPVPTPAAGQAPPAPAPAPAPVPTPESTLALPPPPGPSPTASAVDSGISNAPSAPTAGPAPLNSAEHEPSPAPRDPTAWRQFVAMLVTGLGIPLAYFGRNAIPITSRGKSRASLAGPARRPKSLPGGSGG